MNKIQTCLTQIKQKTTIVPRVAIVLGSGLGNLAESIQIDTILPYQEIDGFPISTAPGHKGRFIFGTVKGVPVVIMQGRLHYYEGYEMSDVVLPIRLMALMGAEILILTNASGGINPSFHPGDLMMITDQISSFVPSPLIGENDEALGVRFPDMSRIYDKELCRLLRKCAEETGISLKEGVYLQTTGPNYESPAEVRMFRLLGADAVAMSTACEAIAANHMGMKICGISCISNAAAGMTDAALGEEEVLLAGKQAGPKLLTLLFAFLSKVSDR